MVSERIEKELTARSAQHMPRIGFHAPVTGGLSKALVKSRALACDAVQIFSRNPRRWSAKPLTCEEIERFHLMRAETKIAPVVIHCNYLVVHPGSAKGACEEDAIRTCAETLRAACDNINFEGLRILLENTAGQGECIGYRCEHLRDIISACPSLNLGVCFDTAHAFAAGYDLREADGITATMKALERAIGMENVRVVHFNDSKAAYNSRVDRHWHIGQGMIGAQGLGEVARYPDLAHAAFLLETPQDVPEDDARNLATLRSFFAEED
jgi:deoxyribonuclease-4